jgi:tetratricopeptide (TPR) repeat protein
MYGKWLCLKVCFTALLLLPLMTSAKDGKKKRARYNYYAAKIYQENQNFRKAHKCLKKAVRLEPGNVYFRNALYHYSLATQKKKTLPEEEKGTVSDPVQQALMLVNNGIQQSASNSFFRSRESFKKALHLIKKQPLANDTLLSHLYNNYASSLILDQAICFNPFIEDRPHVTIHMKILQRAIGIYLLSLKHFPGNPTPIINLETIYKSLDSIDKVAVPEIPYGGSVFYTESTSGSSLEAFNQAVLQKAEEEKRKAEKQRRVAQTPLEFRELIKVVNTYDEVVLLLDASKSMDEQLSGLGASRLEWMKYLLRNLMIFLDEEVKIGCLSVAGAWCAAEPDIKIPVGSVGNEIIFDKIEGMKPSGKTPLDSRMLQSKAFFSKVSNRKMILICSDGMNTCGSFRTCEIAEEIRRDSIDVHVLSFLVDKVKNLMEYAVYDCIAEIGGGQLWKIDASGAIEEIGASLPIMVYPVILPDAFEKYRCLGDHYLHTYKIPLPNSLKPDMENGWRVRR